MVNITASYSLFFVFSLKATLIIIIIIIIIIIKLANFLHRTK